MPYLNEINGAVFSSLTSAKGRIMSAGLARLEF